MFKTLCSITPRCGVSSQTIFAAMPRQNSKRSRNAELGKSSDRYRDRRDRRDRQDSRYADDDAGDSSSEEEIMIVHESDKQRVKRKARAVKA